LLQHSSTSPLLDPGESSGLHILHLNKIICRKFVCTLPVDSSLLTVWLMQKRLQNFQLGIATKANEVIVAF
jgi:hypothetical protein